VAVLPRPPPGDLHRHRPPLSGGFPLLHRLAPLRALILAVCLASSASAAGQAPLDRARQALGDLGVPAGVATALLGDEAEARATLGEPTAVTMVPGEYEPDPERRALVYTLRDGATATLVACSDLDREVNGFGLAQTFCVASWERRFATRIEAQVFRDRARRVIGAAAVSTFGECDTTYYSYGPFSASTSYYGDGPVISVALTFQPTLP